MPWPVSPLPPCRGPAVGVFSAVGVPGYRGPLLHSIGGSNYTLCVHHQAGTRVRGAGITVPRDLIRLLPTARESGRQPFAEADQDQHNHRSRHYAEQDNTCRQVRMSRQVFAEPPGAPGVCRIMRYSPSAAGARWLVRTRWLNRRPRRGRRVVPVCLVSCAWVIQPLSGREKHPGWINVHEYVPRCLD